MTGNNFEIIESAGPGSIVALNGLKSTYAGDVLGSLKLSPSNTDMNSEITDDMQTFDSYNTTKPVVYAALEPWSKSEIRSFENALKYMTRQDPSLHVSLLI